MGVPHFHGARGEKEEKKQNRPGAGRLRGVHSTVRQLRIHPYYAYPRLLDPGIMEALLHPSPKIIYADDGQELYLHICKETDLTPVGIFYRGLLSTVIDLSYYGIDPQGVRAMCMAIQNNKTVGTLNFSQNFLSIDACVHIGMMFLSNQSVSELNLSLCKIGSVGLQHLLEGLRLNFKLRVLILEKNDLTDEAGEQIANALANGLNLMSSILATTARKLNIACYILFMNIILGLFIERILILIVYYCVKFYS